MGARGARGGALLKEPIACTPARARLAIIARLSSLNLPAMALYLERCSSSLICVRPVRCLPFGESRVYLEDKKDSTLFQPYRSPPVLGAPVHAKMRYTLTRGSRKRSHPRPTVPPPIHPSDPHPPTQPPTLRHLGRGRQLSASYARASLAFVTLAQSAGELWLAVHRPYWLTWRPASEYSGFHPLAESDSRHVASSAHTCGAQCMHHVHIVPTYTHWAVA